MKYLFMLIFIAEILFMIYFLYPHGNEGKISLSIHYGMTSLIFLSQESALKLAKEILR